jgi:putative SOS response-associated peptidase YedK
VLQNSLPNEKQGSAQQWQVWLGQPFYISLQSGEQMAFAGMLEFWKSSLRPVES